MFMNTSQTIIVPDERGCFITIPLTSPEVIRVVLKVGVRDLTHRAKLEKFILQKYFPNSLIPVEPQNVLGRVIERTTEVETTVEVVREIIHEVTPELVKEAIVEEEVNDLISSLLKEGGMKEGNRNEQVIIEEDQRERDNVVPEPEEEEIRMSGDFYKRDQDIRRRRSSHPAERIVEETFTFKNYEKQYTMSVMAGRVDSLCSYHLQDMQIDITGQVVRGECQIYTKRGNDVNMSWEHYWTKDFEGTPEKRIRIKIKNDQDEPREIDVNGPLIRQMQVRFDLEGRAGSEVRIRINAKLRLMGWHYRHMSTRKKVEGGKSKKSKRKK